jgi:hypothetical protein
MRIRALLSLMATLLLLWSSGAYADKFSDSYLSMKVERNAISGQWDIALRDLDAAVGLDQNGNGEITWSEVQAKQNEIDAYALSRLALSSDGVVCPTKVVQQLVDRHSDGGYAVLRFTATCPAPIESLVAGYYLLFDIDPQHKGLLKLESDGSTSTAVFSPDRTEQTLKTTKIGAFAQFREYLTVGIGHIWAGFDHLLFLFSLLLPAVLTLVGARWQPTANFRISLVDVLKIVTAFTVAHSITLTLATLQIVSLPSRWVESGIAATVVIAALNNLYPVVQGRRWVAAFAFGLIHGFGFASVLTDLGLPKASLAIALVGFNLGVEIGQLAIVAMFLPIAYGLRRTWLYQKMIFTAGSLMIVLIATIWFVERAFNLQLIST